MSSSILRMAFFQSLFGLLASKIILATAGGSRGILGVPIFANLLFFAACANIVYAKVRPQFKRDINAALTAFGLFGWITWAFIPFVAHVRQKFGSPIVFELMMWGTKILPLVVILDRLGYSYLYTSPYHSVKCVTYKAYSAMIYYNRQLMLVFFERVKGAATKISHGSKAAVASSSVSQIFSCGDAGGGYDSGYDEQPSSSASRSRSRGRTVNRRCPPKLSKKRQRSRSRTGSSRK